MTSSSANVLGGVDSHVHVIGSLADYPMATERRYTPKPASTQDLIVHLEGQGLERAVIIQPSIYGFDNRCTLGALKAMQHKARAVLVLPEDVSAMQLQAYDAQGARGIRLNIESTGHFSASDLASQLEHWGKRLADIGWHIQVYAPMSYIAACANVMTNLPVPVVLDHFALWDDELCASDNAKTLLRLLASGKIYIKLSASYRLPFQCPIELTKIVHRFLFLRPDRLLWGSDWPHTNREAGKLPTEESSFRAIPASSLVGERNEWFGDEDWHQQVLVDNPSQLYRF